MKKIAALIVGSLLLSACSVVQLYDGERRSPDEVARIIGDYRVTAGAPVSVILRQVDQHKLKAGQFAVDLLPGEHSLLVDCRIAETDAVSRHSLDVEVFAGRRYRLMADVAPGLRGCSGVFLEEGG